MGKLFGTDGIRGTANTHPMTPQVATGVGQALTTLIRKHKQHRPRILIGKDTRLSGYMLESALAAGMCSMGADVILAGPIPTPGVAFLANNMDADAGVVISASHNPFEDNGIKIFSREGFKISDSAEKDIEDLIDSGRLQENLAPPESIGKAYRAEDAIGRYIVFLRHSLAKHISLEGMKIALDCANGATYRVAPTLFREMRADVIASNTTPDGKNINTDSGALHPEKLAQTVKREGADLGLAFDGDGDRLIAVDENGDIVSGDKIIAICAIHLKKNGKLKNNTVVTTVMSNLGLGECLENNGIKREIAPVGDRCVLEKMLDCDSLLGGEDSGHIIFRKRHTTGDGILSALYLISVMQATNAPLSELAGVMKVYPQVLKNITVREKSAIEDVPALHRAIKDVERSMDGNGRVLVRYSGTQPMLRVMVEGPTKEETERCTDIIAEAARKALG